MPSILVIDSGVGGLSVCQSIMATSKADERPLQVIYFADDAFSPYGLLDEVALEKRLESIVASMLALHQPELVVLACNTVSTLLLPHLRAQFVDVPFVGVVPAIKPAAKHSTSKCIGLLATPATVSRKYTDELIADYASDCEVLRVGSTDLVMQAEALLAGKTLGLDVIQSTLAPFVALDGQAAVDTVVLGCTHFPLLKKQLQTLLPEVTWIDSGEAIAKRVHDLLEHESIAAQNDCIHQIYFSKTLPDESIFKSALTQLGILESELHLLKVL